MINYTINLVLICFSLTYGIQRKWIIIRHFYLIFRNHFPSASIITCIYVSTKRYVQVEKVIVDVPQHCVVSKCFLRWILGPWTSSINNRGLIHSLHCLRSQKLLGIPFDDWMFFMLTFLLSEVLINSNTFI